MNFIDSMHRLLAGKKPKCKDDPDFSQPLNIESTRETCMLHLPPTGSSISSKGESTLYTDSSTEINSIESDVSKSESLCKEDHGSKEQTTFESNSRYKVTCLIVGSRGDVEPFIALCCYLRSECNFICCIATHECYRDWIESYGIEHRRVDGDPTELMDLCIRNGMFTPRFIKKAAKNFRAWFAELLKSSFSACDDCDLLVASPVAMAGVHIAEYRRIPLVHAFTMPFVATKEYPHPLLASSKTIASLSANKLSFRLVDSILWHGTRKLINKFRKHELGLKPVQFAVRDTANIPFIHIFSPIIVPRPRDWPCNAYICGYWSTRALPPQARDRTLDEAALRVQQFIQRTLKKPIYIGFGSIVYRNSFQLLSDVVEAVWLADETAIICKGWIEGRQVNGSGGLCETPEVSPEQYGRGPRRSVSYPSEWHAILDHVSKKLGVPLLLLASRFLFINAIAHDWLFPQCKVVMHHGGAGTTAAGLYAGVPTIISPFFGDQYFWAQRIQALKVGLWLKRWPRPSTLAEKLKIAANSVELGANAALVAEQLRYEAQDGLLLAVNVIVNLLEGRKELP